MNKTPSRRAREIARKHVLDCLGDRYDISHQVLNVDGTYLFQLNRTVLKDTEMCEEWNIGTVAVSPDGYVRHVFKEGYHD